MKGPLDSVLHSIFKNLSEGVKEKRALLQGEWPRVVGPSFSRQTRPSLQKNGTLCVWVGDSVLAFELGRRHQGTILKRAAALLGEETVQKVVFRVGNIR